MILFSDVSFSTEAVVAVTLLLTSLGGAVGYIFKLLMKSKDDQIALAAATAKIQAEATLKESYKEIAEEAVAAGEAKANKERAKEGKGPLRILAPVVPEHSSPVSPLQEATANVASLRARVTAVTLDFGFPPREPTKPLPNSELIDRVAELETHLTGVKEENLRSDIAKDIAGVKQDVAEVPEKASNMTVEKLKEEGVLPPPVEPES